MVTELKRILMRTIYRYNRKLGGKMCLPIWWDEQENYCGVQLEDGTLLDVYLDNDGYFMYENENLIGGWGI